MPQSSPQPHQLHQQLQALKNHFPLFAGFCLRQTGYQLPEHQLAMAQFLGSAWRNQQKQLLLTAFRGSGKSTLLALFSAWLLLQDPNLRILVLSADETLAGKMVRMVKRMIEQNMLLQHLKPKKLEQWAGKSFTLKRPEILRDPSMLARGITGNITGLRADVIIADDVEVATNCDNADKRQQLRQYLSEVDYVLTPNGTQIYIGTPHCLETIYRTETTKSSNNLGDDAGDDLQDYAGFSGLTEPIDQTAEPLLLAGFQQLTLPLLNHKGQSRWPEKFNTEKIELIRRRHGNYKFFSQMLLKPEKLDHSLLNPNQLQIYDAELELRECNGHKQWWLVGRIWQTATNVTGESPRASPTNVTGESPHASATSALPQPMVASSSKQLIKFENYAPMDLANENKAKNSEKKPEPIGEKSMGFPRRDGILSLDNGATETPQPNLAGVAAEKQEKNATLNEKSVGLPTIIVGEKPEAPQPNLAGVAAKKQAKNATLNEKVVGFPTFVGGRKASAISLETPQPNLAGVATEKQAKNTTLNEKVVGFSRGGGGELTTIDVVLKTPRPVITTLGQDMQEKNAIIHKKIVKNYEVAVRAVACFWDPAFTGNNSAYFPNWAGHNNSKTGDASTLSMVLQDQKGNFYVHRLLYLNQTRMDNENPAQAQITEILAWAETMPITKIMVEVNGLGKFLPSLLRTAIKQKRMHIQVLEIFRRQAKIARIFATYSSLLANRQLYIHQQVRATAFIQEMADFTNTTRYKQKDDGLDAVAGAIAMQFSPLPLTPLTNSRFN